MAAPTALAPKLGPDRDFYTFTCGIGGGAAHIQLPRVTTIIRTLAKELDRYHHREGVRMALELVTRGEFRPAEDSSVTDALIDAIIDRGNEAGLGLQAVQRRAMDRGIRAHQTVEQLLALGPDDPRPDIPQDVPEPGYHTSAHLWRHDFAGEVVATEQVVWSLEHGYAGKFDALLREPGRATDDQLVLADFKTNKDGRAYPEALMQLAAYAAALREHGTDVNRAQVVVLTPTGYKVRPVPDMDRAFRAFAAAKALWQARRNLYRRATP